MVTLTTRQKMLYVLSALFSLLLFFLGRDRITAIISGESKEKIPTSVLLMELNGIPTPSGHTRLDHPQTFDKGVITGVTVYFQSSSPPKEVLDYYYQILPTMGWKFANSKHAAAGEKYKFCKKGMSLTIDASHEGGGTRYYAGIVWTKYRASPTYCAQ